MTFPRKIQAPLLFLAVSLLAYGLQIPWLGFYLDDWIILNAYNLGGVERVFEYAFLDNRPLVFWIWVIGLKLFGTNPVPWQVWALLWRWLSVVFIWLGWRELWPKATRQITLAALLFAVYPLFRQQSSALTYSFHWICLCLYAVSIYTMILAVRQPQRFLLWMTVAVLTGALELFSQEFYVGLELLRPLVLWLVLRRSTLLWKDRFKQVFLHWLPFSILMAAYLVWRFRLMPTPGVDRNSPEIIYGLFTSPFSTLPVLIAMLLQSTVEGLSGVWYKAYEPTLWTISPAANLVAWLVAAAAGFTAWLYFQWKRRAWVADDAPDLPLAEAWYKSAIPFGLLALWLGFAPGWAIGSQITNLSGIYNDRFGLAATMGAAILLVALAEVLFKKEAYSLVFLCLLIGLGVGQNFRFATNYRYSWEKQRQLFWQLKWRAPYLQPGTAIIGDGALISYMGSWATISSIVQMYAPNKNVHWMDYWYFSVNNLGTDWIAENGVELAENKKFMHFRGLATNNVVIDFEPEKLRCLWVLNTEDQDNRNLAPALKAVSVHSNLARIQPEPDNSLRNDIFGPEISRDWCYYYQKSALASQFQDWETVVRLWREAEQREKHPRSKEEYRPFIAGFAQVGEWDTAIALTRTAYFPKHEMRAMLCKTWENVALSTQSNPERDQALNSVMKEFECQDELKDLLTESK